MKTCISCELEKSITDFKVYKSRGGERMYKNQCKNCTYISTKDLCSCGTSKAAKSQLCSACRAKSHMKDHKVCPRCKENKSYNEYHARTEKGGYKVPKSYCKECSKAQSRVGTGTGKNGTSRCECGNIRSSKSTQCLDCSLKSRLVDYTLSEAIYQEGTKGSAYSLIRYRARNILRTSSCEKCGYSLHIEVCHIKPINAFSREARLSEINHPENLIILCRNCHWEFDHGLLTLDQIKNCGL
jgi:hypothetical protein